MSSLEGNHYRSQSPRLLKRQLLVLRRDEAVQSSREVTRGEIITLRSADLKRASGRSSRVVGLRLDESFYLSRYQLSTHQVSAITNFSKMGVPVSQEIKTAVDLATKLKPYAVSTLYTIITVCAINTILLSLLLLAIIGLIISVNLDLAEERKTIVTPFVRWWLPMLGWRKRMGTGKRTAAERGNGRH